ncbi:MAG: ribokinase [Actinobacteria bacterium]|nr:ribokinase [Actinomycetota bacterium]
MSVRAAVVGHVEWVEFIRVSRLPSPGDIAHGEDAYSLPGGGGAVAAVQLSRLADRTTFFTVFGDDELGHRAADGLSEMGLDVRGAFRGSQRRAVTFIDDAAERTIVVIGERSQPGIGDALGWEDLADFDAVYVTAADETVIHKTRRAGHVVATARIMPQLQAAGVRLDALVGSANDSAERYVAGDLSPEPHLVVRTEGPKGGTWQRPGSARRRYGPGKRSSALGDAYGCGDSFAAALTFGLARGDTPAAAVCFASDCGAAVAGARGPYEGQVTLHPLSPGGSSSSKD